VRIPKKIHYCGNDIKVIYKKKIFDVKGEYLGHALTNQNRLLLEYGMDKTKKRETFLHELIHFISDTQHLGLSEKQIDALAPNIIDLIITNNLDFRK